jgi:iron only hydrogenase large subunit-like protein
MRSCCACWAQGPRSRGDRGRACRSSTGALSHVARLLSPGRITIGEELGYPPGVPLTGKLVSALRKLGFDFVFDVLAGADLTIMEEGTELLERLRARAAGDPAAPPLPLLTSCCPGWVAYVEACAPHLIPHLSTAKSPHMMAGTLAKTFLSRALGRPPAELSVTSVMPCVRKQGEADRAWFAVPGGAREVDHVLTTRDVAGMLRARGVDLGSLPEAAFDPFLGLGSGAAALFGTTGAQPAPPPAPRAPRGTTIPAPRAPRPAPRTIPSPLRCALSQAA